MVGYHKQYIVTFILDRNTQVLDSLFICVFNEEGRSSTLFLNCCLCLQYRQMSNVCLVKTTGDSHTIFYIIKVRLHTLK